jgi:hypothetical protein
VPAQAATFRRRAHTSSDQGSGQRQTDAADLVELLAYLIGSVPSHDSLVKLQDLGFQHPELGAKRSQARTRQPRQPCIARIGDHIEQVFDPMASDPRHHPELGKMRSDRVDHSGLLPDEKMRCAVEHQAALLLRCLGLHEPHVRSADGFADGLSVRGVVLLSFEVRLHVGRRH